MDVRPPEMLIETAQAIKDLMPLASTGDHAAR